MEDEKGVATRWVYLLDFPSTCNLSVAYSSKLCESGKKKKGKLEHQELSASA